MSIVSAHLGPVVVTATTVAATFNNARWTVNGSSRLADVTTSATTGSQFLGIVHDPTWEVDAPLDSTQLPEGTTGLTSGAGLAKVFFARGASGSGYRVSLTTIESVDTVNDNTNDAVRVVIRGRGGWMIEGATT